MVPKILDRILDNENDFTYLILCCLSTHCATQYPIEGVNQTTSTKSINIFYYETIIIKTSFNLLSDATIKMSNIDKINTEKDVVDVNG
jgi:hypothetical protein